MIRYNPLGIRRHADPGLREVGRRIQHPVLLIYEPDLAFLRSADSALNGDRAERIARQAKRKQKTAVVFATHKFMDQ